MNRVLKQCFNVFLKTVMFALFAIVFVVFLKGALKPINTNAASSEFYPGFCLGGWDYPQNASGKPSLEGSSNADLFTVKNSAYLEPSIASQIFCGYFPVVDYTNPPEKAKIKFLWSMKFKGEEVTTEEKEGNVTESETHSSDNGIIASSTGFTVIESTSTEDATQEKNTDENIEVIEESGVSPDEQSTNNTEEVIVPDGGQETTTAEPVPEEENSSGPQSVRTEFRDFSLADFFTKIAYAEESETTEDMIFMNDAFLDVSYSMDGIRWKQAGKVGMNNWKDFSIEVPIESWDDLTRLQVMVSVLPSVDERPEIYLESIALSVDFDKTLKETALEGVAYVDGIADALFATTGETAIVLDATAKIEIPVIVPQEPPPPRKIKRLVFELGTEKLTSNKILPWQDQASRPDDENKVVSRPLLDIKTSENKKSLEIQGTCSLAYYVVLMFKNANDYIENPNSFISNIAGPCEDGSFSYNHNVIPVDTPEGDYYLLVAEEGPTGPWMPAGDLIPVHIDSIIETIGETED